MELGICSAECLIGGGGDARLDEFSILTFIGLARVVGLRVWGIVVCIL
jgi:hypothetical protein